MNDNYSTTTMGFAAVLAYVYGVDSLVRVEDDVTNKGQEFHFNIPSLDAEEFKKEYDRGELNISDAKTLIAIFSRIGQTLKKMRREGTTSFCSPSWIAGRGK